METLAWSLVESRLPAETPWTLSMGGTRGVRIGFDPFESRMYVRLPADDDMRVPMSAYSEIDISLRHDDTGPVLEVSTTSSRYFREFHRFASLLAEDYEHSEQTAVGAFLSAIRGWLEFASPKGILTFEQQIGLLGELVLLDGLIRTHGTSSIEAWIGRATIGSLRHDFRIGAVDIEVKTTMSTTRRHFIHGSEQLVPAAGHALYLLSLRLEAAGANAGRSLSEQVAQVRRLLDDDSLSRDTFEKKLGVVQYRDEDELFYGDRLIMSDNPRLIRVDERFPRITQSMLEKELPISVANRIEQVSYLANVEGLGMIAGSPEYLAVFPNLDLDLE